MMNSKLAKIGLIGGAIGTVIGGVGAIVAECRRHKTKKELDAAATVVMFNEIENRVYKAQIRTLQKENAKLKSERKGEKP